MGISISGSNAISGLGGQDTDFDKVLEQLKQIESTNLNRLEAWKSDWNLRYEAFTQIIEQIQAASSMLSQLSDKNNFVSKLVTSSNDNIITAVANASAQDVQHTIKVNQIASNAIWANTGHIFESKTDLINDTGETQYFRYNYAGKDYEFKVPANTTLESFASMINNSSENPGIKVSIIKAGSGYVFQVAGKDTGAANDLTIYDSKLVGMQAAGSTSTWLTNSAVGLGTSQTNPTSYIIDLVLDSGTKKSITVKGNTTAEEFCKLLQNSAGAGLVTASVDADGNLSISGVQSISKRAEDDKEYKAAGVKLSVPGATMSGENKLNASGSIAAGLADDDVLTFTLSDGTNERTVEISAGATYKDFVNAMGNMSTTFQNGGASLGMDKDGAWTMDFTGVTGITVSAKDKDGNAIAAPSLTLKDVDAEGTPPLNLTHTSSDLTITFDKDKLTKRLDGKNANDPAEKLTFTIVDKNGDAKNITIDSNKTYEDLLLEIDRECGNPGIGDDNGNKTIKLSGFKSITQTGGAAISGSGYTTKLQSSGEVTATGADTDLFYKDPATGKLTMEEEPKLVYTFKTNDGKVGTFTANSGATMQQIILGMQYTNNAGPIGGTWEWKDADGNILTGSDIPKLNVKYTDADGNEYLDEDGNRLGLANIDGPVYFQFTNVQSASGPGLEGQVATSSNWSIQRSCNSLYQVDNWPLMMESDSNKISDAIEGVVFDLQEVGEARITVSTDITSVEQSIQNFLDAVNSVLLTVNELMKYDETKQTTSNDPNDIGSDNYSPSGLTNQKGNLLTGNYGVQLFKSRFSSVLNSTPPGFKSQSSATDILSGDLLASLANLGIKTDTDSTSDTYGLLVLAPSSSIAAMQSLDKDNYNDMITNHLEAVVDFFCASGIGSSTSTDFRYDSHVEGITKGGTYDVSYTVVDNGNGPEITKVMIGGYEAKRDESMPGYYYTVSQGDAKGLAITIDDLTEGDHPPAGGEPMQVRVKEGLVQTVNSFLKAELVFNDVSISANSTEEQIADAIYLKSQNGALMSLRDNYKSVMESIDVKIEREQRRLDTWYNRQKAIFANLETLLNQYGEQQKSLEAQLGQLSSD